MNKNAHLKLSYKDEVKIKEKYKKPNGQDI